MVVVPEARAGGRASDRLAAKAGARTGDRAGARADAKAGDRAWFILDEW